MTELLPTYVDQTKKYVHSPAEREYVTTAEPFDNPLFRKRIADEAYAEMLSGVVVHCVDILVYNPQIESFLIGTRQQEPHSGDWVIGGRMRAGESIASSATANIKRELGIDIDATKLRTVGNYQLVWDSRDQPSLGVLDDEANPRKIIGQSTGCHMASTLELYSINASERALLDHNEEYSSLRWLTADEITTAPSGAYHPCLVDMINDGLEVVTQPETPKSLADQQLRLYGQLATVQSAIRQLES